MQYTGCSKYVLHYECTTVLCSVEGQAKGRGGGVVEDGRVCDNCGEGAGISSGGKGAQWKECVRRVPGQLVSNRSGCHGWRVKRLMLTLTGYKKEQKTELYSGRGGRGNGYGGRGWGSYRGGR